MISMPILTRWSIDSDYLSPVWWKLITSHQVNSIVMNYEPMWKISSHQSISYGINFHPMSNYNASWGIYITMMNFNHKDEFHQNDEFCSQCPIFTNGEFSSRWYIFITMMKFNHIEDVTSMNSILIKAKLMKQNLNRRKDEKNNSTLEKTSKSKKLSHSCTETEELPSDPLIL